MFTIVPECNDNFAPMYFLKSSFDSLQQIEQSYINKEGADVASILHPVDSKRFKAKNNSQNMLTYFRLPWTLIPYSYE